MSVMNNNVVTFGQVKGDIRRMQKIIRKPLLNNVFLYPAHMKVVLLAGGMGTRISEETGYRPKPMIEIGGMPILWHIMKEYSYYGFNTTFICASLQRFRSPRTSLFL